MANTKIPVELSSTPSIDDNGNATAITIDSSENVGIGTGNPRGYTNLKTLTINGTNGGVIDFEANGTHLAEIYAEATKLNITAIGTSRDIVFNGNTTERVRIRNSGGITFNGDTAAANALDDYEEGTWTAGFTGSSGTSTGYYTKIGNMVQVIVYSGAISVNAGAYGQITGLPFTVRNAFATAAITHNTYAPNSGGNMYLQLNTTQGYLIGENSLNAVTTAAGTKYVMMTGTYQTDS